MGTTSFRTADFNQKIERQLTLLSKFWEVHTDAVWSGNDEIQSLYYDFMKGNDFLTGDAPNKPKDAREKTSGLIDLGLIDNERRPTAAGESLRQITSCGDFRSNNLLQIPADSYIYFKQMLKTSNDVDGEIVRPFVVLVLALNQLEYLTQEEFTYLLPLITTSRKFRTIVDCIKRLRKGDITIDKIIVDTLLSMENYREARLYLLERPVSEHVICQAGINRKSRQYDSIYYPLYRAIESLDRNNAQSILDLLQACRNIRIGSLWCNHLFKTTNRGKIKKLLSASLNDVPILNCRNEFELKDRFFRLMHLFKVKANLSDYFDLNRRYFGTTDTVLFKDNRVELSPYRNVFSTFVPKISKKSLSRPHRSCLSIATSKKSYLAMISKNPTCIVNWQTSMALPRNRSATFAPFSTTSATSVSTGSSMPVFPTTSCWNCCPTSKPATTSISAGSSPTTPMCPPFSNTSSVSSGTR